MGTAKWSGADRRRHPRVDIAGQASVVAGDTVLGKFRVVNISAGGAFLVGEKAIELGMPIEVRMSLTALGTVNLRAKAVRTELTELGTGVGIQFESTPSFLEGMIHDLVLAELEKQGAVEPEATGAESSDVEAQPTPPTSASKGVDTNMEDRRTAPRIDTEAEVELESDHNFYMGFTENVSEGGLFVATVLVRPIGTKLTVRFTLPGRPEPIVALGEVRWTRPYHDRLDVPSGMGIQFVEMVEEHQAAIRDFVRKRDPIFYDD